jgi:hypothetical protein
MRHDREFWTRHVEAWRTGGLAPREYCRRHRLTRRTFAYWTRKTTKLDSGSHQLVEVGRTEVKAKHQSTPIELAVGTRYLLRLWPGTESAHLQEVLSMLESRS